MPPDASRAPDDLLAHAAFVRALAQAALRGDGECEDVAQDAWVAGIQRAPASAEHRRSWFARVVRHRAIDLLRGRRHRAAREQARARPERTESTLDAVERAETGRRLVAAVLALEEPFRTAVLLRFLDGLPPRAVAARLGVPVETVRSRVRRGLERLRTLLEEREGRTWRHGLAAFGAPALAWGAGALLVGGVAMKKVVVATAAVLLLAGGGWWALERSGERPPPREEGRPALETSAVPAAEGPQLQGSGAARASEPPAGPVAKIPETVAAPRRVRGRVVGEDGTPIAGARLWEVNYATDAIHTVTEEYRGVLAVDETDAEGRFDLPITASWSNGLTMRVTARGWCLPDAGYAGAAVTVTNEKDAVVTMVRGVPLTVTALDDATGRPIVGAAVQVFTSRGYVLYSAPLLAAEATGADGVALLRVPGGALRVVVGAPGFAQREGEGLNVGAEGGRVTVRLERGGTLEGVVVDPDGRPVPHARLGLLRAPAAHLRTIADGDGRFRFPHVSSRGATGPDVEALRLALIAVDAEGFVRTWSAGDPPPEGGTAQRRIVMLRPQVLAGIARYGDGTRAGSVRMVASTVVGEPAWGWSTSTDAASVLTGPDGSFRLEGVTPGKVTLRGGARTDGEPLLRLEVRPHTPPAPVDVVVEREFAPVKVRVRDAGGRPVKGASVGLVPVERADVGMGGQRSTDAGGTVSLPPSGPAPWWLFVDAPRAGPLLRRVEAAEAAAGPIEVGPGDATIEGRAERVDGSAARVKLALDVVMQAENVRAYLSGWQGAVETDADGRFRFAGVHPGVTGVRAVSPGWTVLPAVVPDLSPGARELRVVVIDEVDAARLRLEAEVLDDRDQQPIPAQVTVLAGPRGEPGQWPLFLVQGSTTRFRSERPFEPGTWTLTAYGPGYLPTEVEVVQPRAGGLAPVRILLRQKP